MTDELRRHQDGENEAEEAEIDWREHKFDADLKLDIQREIQKLPIRERRVIILRFFEGETLQACAENMGITRERVRQIELHALLKLRRLFRKAGLDIGLET